MGGPTYSNAYYREKQENSYHSLKAAMVSSMEEFFQKITEWLCPKRATYGNPNNTYSYMYDPVLYDYIWHRGRGRNMIWTNFFDVPFLKTLKILPDSTDDYM